MIGSAYRQTSQARALAADERGSALLEFALIASVFFLTILGTMEYGRMVFESNMVSFAAREGARYASVRGTTGAETATVTQIKNYTAARSSGVVTSTNVTVHCGASAADITGDCATANVAGNYVQVRTQATFTTGIPLLPLHSVDLSSTTQLLISR